jgi:hypothetical protein
MVTVDKGTSYPACRGNGAKRGKPPTSVCSGNYREFLRSTDEYVGTVNF